MLRAPTRLPLVDVLLVDALMGGTLAVCAAVTETRAVAAPQPWAAVLVAVWMGALVLRTAAPMGMAVIGAAGALAYGFVPGAPQTPFWAFLAVLIMGFSVGLHLGGRRRAAAAGLLVVTAAVLSFVSSTERDPGDLYVAPVVIVAGPCLAGGLLRRSRQQTAELRRVSRTLVDEREAHVRDAAAAERNRLARELHDVISQSVSEMLVQAAAAEQQLPAASPVRELVADLRGVGREALTELRQQLGALREGPEGTPAPMPVLADLPALAADSDADLAYDATQVGDVPPGAALTSFRVVQEALTNARKHAAGAAVQVVVHRDGDALVVEVVNGPSRTTVDVPGGGHGLPGMRERVDLYAGHLEVGPTEAGGWRVLARLPLTAAGTPSGTSMSLTA